MKKVKLSERNIKLGKLLNCSLSPIKGCRPDAPCCKECYALKAYRQYPSVRAAWDHNLDLAWEQPHVFFSSIIEQLQARKPNYFRWHVAGDILSPEYLAGMVWVAETLSDWHFLAYTKNYDDVNSHLDDKKFPPNLQIIMSQWPGLDLVNPHGLPVATYDAAHGTDCPGSCATCKICWHSDSGINFPAH